VAAGDLDEDAILVLGRDDLADEVAVEGVDGAAPGALEGFVVGHGRTIL
jgi:hypothetical protein